MSLQVWAIWEIKQNECNGCQKCSMLGVNCFTSLDTGLHLGVILTKEEATDCWRFSWQSPHFMLTWTHECKWSPIIFVVIIQCCVWKHCNTENLAVWKRITLMYLWGGKTEMEEPPSPHIHTEQFTHPRISLLCCAKAADYFSMHAS